MKKKMFGHVVKSKQEHERVPGQPYSNLDVPYGHDEDNPPGYEGKEHVKYRNPGFSPHHINTPDDEPHMKSHVSSDEEHEMEDNYHMDVPDQTEHSLEHKLKRARMKMDAPDQEDPDELRGNITHNVPYQGEEDTSGEEEEGPNHMQSENMSKEHRKRLATSIIKQKLKKHHSY